MVIIIPLILTIIIEAIVAFIMGYRDKNSQLAILATNCLTNTSLNFLILILPKVDNILIAILEITVVFIEWAILMHLLEKQKLPLLILSIAINATSFLIGLLLFLPE